MTPARRGVEMARRGWALALWRVDDTRWRVGAALERRGVTRRGRILLLVACGGLLLAGLSAVLLIDFGAGGEEDPAAARRRSAAVTEADNGGEVTVPPDTAFVVDLAGSADAPWGLPVAATTALARVSTSQDANGSAAATFTPLEIVPRATITAERVPACRTASPPCEAPTERFEVTVRVGP